MSNAPVEIGTLAERIVEVRGLRVILDRDLAALYGVRARALRQQVRRNLARFPADFMVVLKPREARILVSQSVIPAVKNLGGSVPYAFTEQGVAMLSSVLTSERAIAVNIAVMRTFVRLREMVASNRALSEKLTQLEQKIGRHDSAIIELFNAIRSLMHAPRPKNRPIGFTADLDLPGDE